MRILVPVVLVIALGAAWASIDTFPSTQEMCKLQSAAAVPQDPQTIFNSPPLSKSEIDKISDARACPKTFALQFPGGFDALAKATPVQLKENLDDLKAAFASPKNVPIDLSNPYSMRMALIRNGWNREQVLLFGNYLMLLRLYDNGDYGEVLKIVAELRPEMHISVKPVVWDDMQNHTYFSADTLLNMISSIEYLSKVRTPGTTKEAMAETVGKYMKDRSNLMPLGDFARNPDSIMFQGYCGSN